MNIIDIINEELRTLENYHWCSVRDRCSLLLGGARIQCLKDKSKKNLLARGIYEAMRRLCDVD